jgi:uncharacterized protein YraI
MRSVLFRLAALAGLLLACGATASAEETGTLAWTISDLTVYEGPGTAYDVLGGVPGKIHVRVDRCTYQWCQIHDASTHGWVWRDDLSFGTEPRGPFTGPILKYKSGGPGTVCLFEGHDYSGASICMHSGAVSRDLLLLHLDNRYSSVTVEGNVSVTLCRDRDFSSYCERVNESQPRLQGFLDNAVSSYWVH